jgi:hypothetical protein
MQQSWKDSAGFKTVPSPFCRCLNISWIIGNLATTDFRQTDVRFSASAIEAIQSCLSKIILAVSVFSFWKSAAKLQGVELSTGSKIFFGEARSWTKSTTPLIMRRSVSHLSGIRRFGREHGGGFGRKKPNELKCFTRIARGKPATVCQRRFSK